MTTQTLVDVSRVPTTHPMPKHRSTVGIGHNPSTAYVAGLQRSVGNAAVARHLAGQRSAAGGQAHPGAAVVQRCGPVPCNCSGEERADYAATHSGETSDDHGAEEVAAEHAPAAVQRHAAAVDHPGAEQQVSRSIAQRLDSARSGGDGIEEGVKLRLQRSFGTDLSPVRVHTNGEADALSRDVGATAFTTGHHIFFRSGEYNPSGATGFSNLAHEVTHVVQQSNGNVPGRDNGGGLSVSDEHDAGEQEAAASARTIAGANDAAAMSGAEPPASGPARTGTSAPQVQRLKALGTPPARPIVQRLTDPLGTDLVVDWTTPGAAVALSDQAGGPVAGGAPLNFNGGDSASFTVPGRTTSADITFPVTASWHGKGVAPVPPGPVPPGPTPGADCDACKVLIEGATANTCKFIGDVVDDATKIPLSGLIVQGLCIPIVAAIGGSIDLLPAEILKACKSSNIDDLINRIRELRENIEKTSSFTKVIDQIVKELRKIPVLAQIAGAADLPRIIREQIAKRLGDLIEKLKELRDKCKKGDKPTPAGGQGQATSTMKTKVFMLPDGQVKAVGPGPAQNVSGTGATEESPVRFSQDGVPNSALVTQVPTIVADGANGGKAGRQFTVNILYGLPPAPQAITCPPVEFFPFRVAKDQFEDELDAQKKIRDWFFGHDPEIRNTVQTGASTVKITGRASNTGAVEFNRQLAEKRAKRVETIVRDFAGTDSNLRAFSFGFLTAKEPGESGHERRAEAQIEGEVPADRVALMKGGDACVGHNGESSDQGPTGPQTSPLADLAGPGSDTPATAAALQDAGSPVVELDSGN